MSASSDFFGKCLHVIAEALYPSRVACIFCGEEAILDENGICDRCGSQLVTVESCEHILKASPIIDDMNATFRYSGYVAIGVKRLKYHRCTYLAKEFARYMDVKPNWNIDMVVPVPLHPLKLRLRGYNQCEKLARCICKKHNLTLNTKALRKVVYTRSQTSQNYGSRQKNLSKVFLANENECKGKSVLIVDDVCTTGATLRECAAELKSKGATRVYALVLCLSRESNAN